jgi:guanylate kinase
MSNRRGLCLVLAAPSGAGKTSLSRALLAEDSALSLSVSVTTRPPRPGEVEGKHYFFTGQTEFEAMAAAGKLLEYATVFGKSYGTPRAPVEAALADARDVLFDIDWQGFRQLRAALVGDVVGVFIRAPSLAALRARLAARGDSDAEIARRMAHAEAELSHASEFDFLVENADFDTALADLRAILRASRLASFRQTG